MRGSVIHTIISLFSVDSSDSKKDSWCCQRCYKNKECEFWVLTNSSKYTICWLKKNYNGHRYNTDYRSAFIKKNYVSSFLQLSDNNINKKIYDHKNDLYPSTSFNEIDKIIHLNDYTIKNSHPSSFNETNENYNLDNNYIIDYPSSFNETNENYNLDNNYIIDYPSSFNNTQKKLLQYHNKIDNTFN